MTKNEYIASILLEAAELLKNESAVISISNLSPIVTGTKFVDKERVPESYSRLLYGGIKRIKSQREAALKDSDVAFSNGEYSAICDNRFTSFQTGDPFGSKTEDVADVNANMFSPNNTKPAPDPFVASNNFETNEDVRVNYEMDPVNGGYPTPASIAGVYKSNFINED